MTNEEADQLACAWALLTLHRAGLPREWAQRPSADENQMIHAWCRLAQELQRRGGNRRLTEPDNPTNVHDPN